MGIQDIYAAVKRATVAIVLEFPDRIPARPFTIVGSGLCIHPAGVVVTCEHVFRAFVDPAAYQRVMEAVKEGRVHPFHELAAARPHAMFFAGVQGHEVTMFPVPIVNATTKIGHDLALLKLQDHGGFSSGFLTLQVADYHELHEDWSCPGLMDGLGLKRAWLGHHVSFRIRWVKDSPGPSGGVRDCRSLR
jgi:hypothetical protein